METKSYNALVVSARTLKDLELVKENFLRDYDKQKNVISVADLLSETKNFGDAKAMFESMIPSLLKMKGGKSLINKFAKIVKENQSLKTLYALHEGVKSCKDSDSKKNYITEALSITNLINHDDYLAGLSRVCRLLGESFNLLGAETVLNTVSHDKDAQMLGESLYYLASQKKTIKNLNEYISYINVVTESAKPDNESSINVNKTLEEIVSEMKGKVSNNNFDSIFEADNKEKAFCDAKKVCLEMISKQKSATTDNDVRVKLVEMEEKLTKKNYNFDSYTKDMLYMTELQEVLK